MTFAFDKILEENVEHILISTYIIVSSILDSTLFPPRGKRGWSSERRNPVNAIKVGSVRYSRAVMECF